MKRKVCFSNKTLLLFFIIPINLFCFGQFVVSGKIHYERKTNLQKLDNSHMPKWMQDYIEKEKYVVDHFVLSFDDKKSLFEPANPPTSDWKEMLTIKNTILCDHQTDERLTVMNVMGQSLYVKDTINKIPWKITDNMRVISGYNCQMAYYQKDTSTTIYAWYAQEIVPSVGPETLIGLPGAILGLATENGVIVYFAKSIEIQKIDEVALQINTKKKKIYTKEELKKEILKNMGNTPSVQGIMSAYFMWHEL